MVARTLLTRSTFRIVSTPTRYPLFARYTPLPARIPLFARYAPLPAGIPLLARAMSDVKTGAVLDASELADGEMKIVDFEGGQVLLSKVKGEVVSVAYVGRS